MTDNNGLSRVAIVSDWHRGGLPEEEGTYLILKKYAQENEYQIACFYKKGSIISQTRTKRGTYNAELAMDSKFYQYNIDDHAFHGVESNCILAWAKLPEIDELIDMLPKWGGS